MVYHYKYIYNKKVVMRKLLITEEEKNHIKELHNLKEQSFIERGLELAFKNLFDGSKKKGHSEKSNETEKINRPTTQKGSVDFAKVTKQVVDKLEGGYYNPKWHFSSGMGKSGETMFGIDRKWGGNLNTSPAGIEFWNLIDKNKNKDTWKHYYRGGQLEPELLDLVVKIMEPHYNNLSNKYLIPESKTIVESDERLLFHFIYASWNGSGWFKKFATEFNKSVEKGITDPDELLEVAINSRINSGNSIIARGGKKIESFVNNLA